MARRLWIPPWSAVTEIKENCCFSAELTGSHYVTWPCTVGQACPPSAFLAKRPSHLTPQFRKEMLCVCAGENLQVNQPSLWMWRLFPKAVAGRPVPRRTMWYLHTSPARSGQRDLRCLCTKRQVHKNRKYILKPSSFCYLLLLLLFSPLLDLLPSLSFSSSLSCFICFALSCFSPSPLLTWPWEVQFVSRTAQHQHLCVLAIFSIFHGTCALCSLSWDAANSLFREGNAIL